MYVAYFFISKPNLPNNSTRYFNSTPIYIFNSSKNFHFICILKKIEPMRGHLPGLLPIRELYAPTPIITLPYKNFPSTPMNTIFTYDYPRSLLSSHNYYILQSQCLFVVTPCKTLTDYS